MQYIYGPTYKLRSQLFELDDDLYRVLQEAYMRDGGFPMRVFEEGLQDGRIRPVERRGD